jgi:hypothetical protein
MHNRCNDFCVCKCSGASAALVVSAEAAHVLLPAGAKGEQLRAFKARARSSWAII